MDTKKTGLAQQVAALHVRQTCSQSLIASHCVMSLTGMKQGLNKMQQLLKKQ